MAQLEVHLGNLSLQNPVMTASGTFGYGVEFADFVDLDRLGAFIVKGTTLLPREGNDYPRMAETASGMLNCVGLQNKGVDYFAEHIYPRAHGCGQYDVYRFDRSPNAHFSQCGGRRSMAVFRSIQHGVQVATGF